MRGFVFNTFCYSFTKYSTNVNTCTCFINDFIFIFSGKICSSFEWIVAYESCAAALPLKLICFACLHVAYLSLT